ncbi:MAG: hydrogenase 4 subunit B [Raoultibacter sp.]
MSAYLLLLSVAFSSAGAFIALLLGRFEKVSKVLGCFFGGAAALVSLFAGALAIFGQGSVLSIAGPFYFANFTLLLNPLAGLLIVIISVLALAAWMYGFSYFDEYAGKGIGGIGFFMNLFIASMLLVIAADNAFWFLVFFELMSLTSYFLVIFEQNEKAIRGGFLYFVMAHIGFMLIMIAFLIMANLAGSFEFADFRILQLPMPLASLIFVLGFLGFGIKAGMFPFHSWLPQAHPAAPSNVSALMSGGMVKIGIFGIVKVCFDLLGSSGGELWWGLLVLVFGSASAVLGIAYATAEHDIKRVLAYCSVDNIGIILIGVGIGIVGWTLGMPLVAGLGLMAALYHVLNHAMFKGLLFLGAGSVLFRTHTRNMDELGGLARLMPLTAGCFLVGSLAICAVPPLNGFVSEWFTYQALFDAALGAGVLVQLFAGVAVVSLAMTGALALVCFVKTYGVTFSGAPRSACAVNAREVPLSMRAGMVFLTVICIALGVCASWIAPIMHGITSSILGASLLPASDGAFLVNLGADSAVSTLLIALILLVLILLIFAARALLARKGGLGIRREPWDCGYVPDSQMLMKSSTFSSTVDMFFSPLYQVRSLVVDQGVKVKVLFEGVVNGVRRVEPLGDRYLVDAVVSFISSASRKSQKIEGGDFRVYILYIVVTLVFFLILAVVVK